MAFADAQGNALQLPASGESALPNRSQRQNFESHWSPRPEKRALLDYAISPPGERPLFVPVTHFAPLGTQQSAAGLGTCNPIRRFNWVLIGIRTAHGGPTPRLVPAQRPQVANKAVSSWFAPFPAVQPAAQRTIVLNRLGLLRLAAQGFRDRQSPRQRRTGHQRRTGYGCAFSTAQHRPSNCSRFRRSRGQGDFALRSVWLVSSAAPNWAVELDAPSRTCRQHESTRSSRIFGGGCPARRGAGYPSALLVPTIGGSPRPLDQTARANRDPREQTPLPHPWRIRVPVLICPDAKRRPELVRPAWSTTEADPTTDVPQGSDFSSTRDRTIARREAYRSGPRGFHVEYRPSNIDGRLPL